MAEAPREAPYGLLDITDTLEGLSAKFEDEKTNLEKEEMEAKEEEVDSEEG